MGNEVAFRTSLVSLAAIVALTGLYTQSVRKMAGTYLFGMLAIGGLALPDWKFFDRPVSQWCTVVDIGDRPSRSAPESRLKLYPVRLVIYTTVYGLGFYHWFNFIRR
ncbi:hypothetical protein PHJA_001831500 [Phtheirospermum japonicum]|uniref:Microsomal signal peptidase 12 kDa subunit n=1 Tax=Phtheirospermum japonicum TaxID=374723 RepID=A0A830CKW0_9LAMI|nr:hypothetical protein PHJA_001831500 [Phtheirospermum japonicum]